MKFRFNKNRLILFVFAILISSCNKLVSVPEPINTITTSETFKTDANATSAIIGIYSTMIGSNSIWIASGGTTIFGGLSADELSNFGGDDPFQSNTLLADNGNINSNFWIPAYSIIYKANSVIEGLQVSSSVSTAVKNQLTGEAKTIRAFTYFYLVNLFGNIPLVLTTSYATSDTLHQASSTHVYEQIIKDLKDAQGLLSEDYKISSGERIRINKWAATALLSRVYLFTGDWMGAEDQATAVIGATDLYKLETDLNAVFLANSQEAIWQLQVPDNYPYATNEGNQFIPGDNTSSPRFSITDQLLAAFESNDARRTEWIDSTNFSGQYWYYPYKYKIRAGTQGSITEYYMVLRLAEQYLIRAEARTQRNINLRGAIDDLNQIRERALLLPLLDTLNQTQVLAAVAKERQTEFFAEWANRWIDLKRWGQANSVLGAVKPTWKASAALYPIPVSELQADPNLKQNPGY